MKNLIPNEEQLFEGTKTFHKMVTSDHDYTHDQIKAIISYGKNILKVDFANMSSILYSEMSNIRKCVHELEEKLNEEINLDSFGSIDR